MYAHTFIYSIFRVCVMLVFHLHEMGGFSEAVGEGQPVGL